MLILLKLFLVPSLVAVVTLAVRRWGPAVGGWLAGMPVVAGPVLVFYALEQGTAFAAQAAQATLAGLIGTVAFGVAYARCAIHLPWYACVGLGWAAFGATIAVLYAWQPALLLSLASLVLATVIGRRLLPRPAPSRGPAVNPRGDLVIRLVATAVLVFLLTGLAARLGPRLSGLLNAFPILTTIIAAFTHAQRGREAVAAFVHGYLRAIVGFAGFCVVMAVTVEGAGLLSALALALMAQLVVNGLMLWRPGSASMPGT